LVSSAWVTEDRELMTNDHGPRTNYRKCGGRVAVATTCVPTFKSFNKLTASALKAIALHPSGAEMPFTSAMCRNLSGNWLDMVKRSRAYSSGSIASVDGRNTGCASRPERWQLNRSTLPSEVDSALRSSADGRGSPSTGSPSVRWMTSGG